MRKNKDKKRNSTDKWNEGSINSEEEETREEDEDWSKKHNEDEEMGENEDEFHEGDYDREL